MSGLFIGVLLSGSVQAGYKDDVGYTKLVGILSNAVPRGIGIPVSQVEAPVDSVYLPDASSGEFIGKVITDISGISNGISGHATSVGEYFFGTNTSLAPGITNISIYHANHWLDEGCLHNGLGTEPGIETNRIQNHSWIGSGSGSMEADRRLDYAIDRDGFVAVVGLSNSNSDQIPEMLAHSYNSISVGLSSGGHSSGATTFDQAGRVKPEIVAPLPVTSLAAPVVGAASAMLMEVIDGDPALANAGKPQCIKAILMAGATKDEFPSWNRTSSSPIDGTYGAGELNVYNSYYLLDAGDQPASLTNLVGVKGWNYHFIEEGSNLFYFFQVPESNVLTRFSAALVWNRQVTNASIAGFDPVPSVGNLDLYLYEATGFTAVAEIDVSTSVVDNVEYIYRRNMPAGRYALKLSSDTATNFALAWLGTSALIPEFSSIVMSDGLCGVQASVSAGMPYGVQATTNLLETNSWVWLATNTSFSNMIFFVDSAVTNLTQRFYRIIPDP